MKIMNRSKLIILCTILILSCILVRNKVQAEGFSRDVNGDGIIDIIDVAQLARCYNMKSLDSNWNSSYDFTDDNIIDLYDMVLIAKAMGQTVNSYTAGNTSGNFANNSFAAMSEGFIYYNKSSDGYKIYRERLDGSEQASVSDVDGSSINVVGDWVYYTVFFGDTGIYKVKKDGTSKTKVSSDRAMYIYVVDDWIYYAQSVEGDDIRKIYRTNTDGTLKEEIKLCNDNSLYYADYEFNVEGDWIYTNVINPSEGKVQFYRVKVDGSARNLILDEQASRFSIENGWVYYIGWVPNEGYKEVCKIRPDGTQKTVILRTNTDGFGLYSLNVSEGYIYFTSDNQSADLGYIGIYKMNIDGTDVRKLTNTWCKHLCIVGEWIYFDGESEFERNTMKIKVDGTGEANVY
jgi:hypothetical protein